jgi:hypothetical protein
MNILLSTAVGCLSFTFLSIFFILIKSGERPTDVLQILPPNFLLYYLGFFVFSLAIGYITFSLIKYFKRNFGDFDDMPTSKTILFNNYKSPFLRSYVRVAGMIYIIFLITGFLIQFSKNDFGEKLLLYGSLLSIFGSIPVAYFLSKKSAK